MIKMTRKRKNEGWRQTWKMTDVKSVRESKRELFREKVRNVCMCARRRKEKHFCEIFSAIKDL